MNRRSTSQDVSWFLDLRRHKQLDLDPPYQRRSAWNLKDRRFFLDTVFRGYPCPPIFLHKTEGIDQQTVYAVVDGKQRLQTLFKFVDDEISLDPEFGDERFNGKLWSGMGSAEKQAFRDYVIPVEFLMFEINDTKAVSHAFDRLNRNMRKLEPQELRHARWDGWFIQLVEGECDVADWQELGIVTSTRSARMKDAQFISELLLVLIHGKQFGFDQQMLDDAYATFDDPNEEEEPIDTVGVKAKLASVKRYLLQMQEKNGCVKTHAKTLAIFYTLWSAVALHSDAVGEADDFAVKFSGFMAKVKEINDNPALVGTTDIPATLEYRRAAEFAKDVKGATTDLAPRARRLEALLNYLRGE